jgi:endonuclease/exonuclease/phosphatase family metal-dependent hydrolase
MPSATLDYRYDLPTQVAALKRHRDRAPGRVPPRRAGKLLVASWNIARLGANERRDEDYELLSTMLGWFDLVALQEVRANLAGLRAVQSRLPDRYRVLFSDTAGNNERMAFLYDSRKVRPLEEIGEIGFPPRELASIRQDPVGAAFDSFDRTPHLAAFEAGGAVFLLANVHLYFGKGTALSRRAAEAFAVASWAKRRQRDKHAFTRHVLAVGDFNLPKVDPNDRIYKALTAKGLLVPANAATRIGTNLDGTKQYDQVVVLPEASSTLGESGVFDFDTVLFADLELQKRRPVLRYRISDHRILWFALMTAAGPEEAVPVRAPRRRAAPAWGELVRPA